MFAPQCLFCCLLYSWQRFSYINNHNLNFTLDTLKVTDYINYASYFESNKTKEGFLRNNWYLENELGTIKGAVAGQPFVYSAADGKAGWALEAYYAEAAARVLVADNAKDIYEFSGSFATYADLASATKSASGKNFDVLAIDDPAYTAGLKDAGLDDDTAALVTMFQTLIRDGNLDVPSTDLVDVLGHPLPELRDQLKTII